MLSSYNFTKYNAFSNQKQTIFKKSQNEKHVYQICDKVGHNAQTCFALQYFLLEKIGPFTMVISHKGMVESSSTDDYSSWILDTSTCHHVTSNVEQLSSSTPYFGHEVVMISDGQKIPIA